MEWNEIIFPTSERRWISVPSLGDWLPVRTSLLWMSCNLSLVDSRVPSWTDRTTWRTLISLSSELRLLFSSLLLPCSWSQKSLSFPVKSNEGGSQITIFQAETEGVLLQWHLLLPEGKTEHPVTSSALFRSCVLLWTSGTSSAIRWPPYVLPRPMRGTNYQCQWWQ